MRGWGLLHYSHSHHFIILDNYKKQHTLGLNIDNFIYSYQSEISELDNLRFK